MPHRRDAISARARIQLACLRAPYVFSPALRFMMSVIASARRRSSRAHLVGDGRVSKASRPLDIVGGGAVRTQRSPPSRANWASRGVSAGRRPWCRRKNITRVVPHWLVFHRERQRHWRSASARLMPPSRPRRLPAHLALASRTRVFCGQRPATCSSGSALPWLRRRVAARADFGTSPAPAPRSCMLAQHRGSRYAATTTPVVSLGSTTQATVPWRHLEMLGTTPPAARTPPPPAASMW